MKVVISMSWIGRVHKCAIVFFITIITPSAAEEAPSGNGLKEDEAIVRDLEFFEAMELSLIHI